VKGEEINPIQTSTTSFLACSSDILPVLLHRRRRASSDDQFVDNWYRHPSSLAAPPYFTRRARMAGAADPSVAAALDAQSKSIDIQSRTLATQSKILQQLCDRLDSQDQKWNNLEQAVDHNATKIVALQRNLESGGETSLHSDLGRIDDFIAQTTTRMAGLETATSAFESWRPRVEGSIDSVRTSVETMRSELGRLTQLLEGGLRGGPEARTSILGPFIPVAERPSVAATHTDMPHGHRPVLHPREHGVENVSIPTHLPNNGTHVPCPSQAPATFPSVDGWDIHQQTSVVAGGNGYESFSNRNLGNLPKLHFPSFDGENPKLWKSRCEDYFLMYSVDPRVWIKVASMQFVGSAARWLQSIESRVVHISWGEFGNLVLERFGRDQHQGLLRQLFHIRQTGSVVAYAEEFSN
jgi:hypothetical protein